MTEQQRRDQIMQERQQAGQARSAAPAMSDAEAQQIASENQGLTQEQMIAIAMMGKFVQNDVMGVKKAGMGDLKVSDVDMSKVMPSGIAKAMGQTVHHQTQQPPLQVIHQTPPMAPAVSSPGELVNLPFIAVNPALATDTAQIEFDFERKARYEDIMQSIDKLENKIILLTNKINDLSTKVEYTKVDKKKPKKNLDDGPQAG
jgi:hypothetical protein